MMNSTTITNFINITKYPIKEYFNDSNTFFRKSFPRIVEFYNGKRNDIEQVHINLLKSLLARSLDLSNQFKINKHKFTTVDFWEMLDIVEDIKTKLETTANISKYLRSSITNTQFSKGILFDYTLNDEDTLELVSKNVLKKKDFDNDWSDIALKNDLREIDYEAEGGTTIQLIDNSFQANLVTSIIDNTIGEKVYGLDIQKNLSFEDNDLKVLSYRDTVFQAVEILSKLTQGDVPEFPGLGVNNKLFKGANFAQVNYASIIRELNKNFSSDDLFVNFQVLSMKYLEGDIYIEFKVGTKFDLVIVKDITI